MDRQTDQDAIDAPRHKFEALDGLRGLLALTVALGHFPIFSHFYLSANVRTSGYAVDFFFVLSGFVISYASLPDLTSAKSILVFIIRRFGRLWPLHATMLGALVALELFKLAFTNETGITGQFAAFAPDSAKSVSSIFTNLLMVQSLNIHDKWTWNGPSWSISTEFYAYILFAVIAVSCRRYLTLLAALLALASGVFFVSIGPDIDTTFQYGFFRCVCGFFIGHIVYRLWLASKTKSLVGASALELACIGMIIAIPSIPVLEHFSILVPLFFATHVWVFAHQEGVVSRALRGPQIQYLGMLSYSIYLDHQLVIDIVKRSLFVIERFIHTKISFTDVTNGIEGVLFKINNEWIGDILTVGFLAAVIALAGITYRYVESPSRKFFNSLAKKLTPGSRGTVTAAV